MNYLAHLYLSDSDDHHRLGNLAGDWIKGRLENHGLPDRVLDGARRHRYVDSASDQHPAMAAARTRLGPDRRRAAGIILDMVNDHFLVRHWDDYADTPLPRFLDDAYGSLERTRALWPTGGERMMERMIRDDWLSSYGDLAIISMALERIAMRMRRDPGLSDTLPLLRREYDTLEAHFHRVMGDLRAQLRPR
ncbi:ACP phosphodiesterase [Aquisalimonas asiatica]|uniref:Acyl carrier protein phosphodiesterase n=1 Tax=Aquisalimonas asiatica TaxID=406100 RepID=A0A1H8Q6M8_9GAMM|nr:ACP phosphodiesterase [Aquisalimonas asiatica]SEO49879.1 Acyl carrier protein phosphodiesterase [Aquisalimonas asiatica]